VTSLTVAVVLSKIDAERALPWDHEGPHTGAEQRDYGRAIAPSVKWIVVAKPIVCPSCEGSCRQDGPIGAQFPTYSTDCTDCIDGLPDVEIVSQEIQRKLTVGFCHGIVPIGPAVPIADNPDTNPGDCIVVEDGRVWLWDTNPYHEPLDITDQFGSQAPIGHAHLIQPKETIE